MKNNKICDDSDSRCGEEHEMDDDTYSIPDAIRQKSRDNIYIYIYMAL